MKKQHSKASDLLKYYPNLQNKQRLEYDKVKEKLNGSPVHNYWREGFEAGYQYAIQRLEKSEIEQQREFKSFAKKQSDNMKFFQLPKDIEK